MGEREGRVLLWTAGALGVLGGVAGIWPHWSSGGRYCGMLLYPAGEQGQPTGGGFRSGMSPACRDHMIALAPLVVIPLAVALALAVAGIVLMRRRDSDAGSVESSNIRV